MIFCKRSAIWVCLTLAVSAGPVRAQFDQGPDPEARAARRAEARSLVIQDLTERSVRAIERATLEKDAAGIVDRLSEEQVEALLAGEDLISVVTQSGPERTAAAVTDGSVEKPVTAEAIGDATSDLLFVPLPPCRIIDTRAGGGIIVAGTTRPFRVAGTTGFAGQGGQATGCGVPISASTPQAAAVMINLVAVDVAGKGNLRAWAFGQPEPLATSINFQKIDMNIANGLIIPIAGLSTLSADLNVQANFANAHLVADVTGYFTRFPVEEFQGGLKSDLVTQDFTTLVNLNDGACHELNSCTITAAGPGTVIVEAWGQFVMSHTAGTLDRVAIGVETASPVTCLDPDSVQASDYEVPASLGSNPDVDFTISHGVAFAQPGGTTRTYRLSGKVVSGANTGDKVENSRVICTFIPD
jgi:hypothetical protein